MIFCCCVTCLPLQVIVKDCDGNNLSGASVTATDGTTTIGPLTTSGAGVVNFSPPIADGIWTVTASKSGFQTMSASVAYVCATGASVTISYKLFAPATLTITSGGQSFTLTRSTVGSTYHYGPSLGTTQYYPVATSLHNDVGGCTAGAGAQVIWGFDCGGATYRVTFAFCSPAPRPYSDGGPHSGFDALRTNTATIISFSVSPFLVTGTWSATWDQGNNPAANPNPGDLGSSFTIS